MKTRLSILASVLKFWCSEIVHKSSFLSLHRERLITASGLLVCICSSAYFAHQHSSPWCVALYIVTGICAVLLLCITNTYIRIGVRVLFSSQMPKDIAEHRLTSKLKLKHYHCLVCGKRFYLPEEEGEKLVSSRKSICPNCGSWRASNWKACPLCDEELWEIGETGRCAECGYKVFLK